MEIRADQGLLERSNAERTSDGLLTRNVTKLVYVNRTFYESSKVVDITGDNDNEAERVVKILSIHSVPNRLLSIFYF